VNTTDQGGGAERRAWCLFKGFQKRGVDSWLLVGQKKSADERVIAFHESPYFDYRPYDKLLLRLKQRCRKWLTRSLGREDFEFSYSKHVLELTGTRPDLVHCQNLHGGYFDLRVLAGLSQQVPVFLTLHDCWSYTGHCAHSFDCQRWQTGCGACPYLSIPPAVRRDGTRWNWQRKKEIFARCRLHVAAPSHWLMQRALQSILTPAIIDSRIIVPGVDLNVFKPAPQQEVRHQLGIPQDVAVVVFVANQGRNNPFKDYATMKAAMLRLSGEAGASCIHMYCIGEDAPDERRGRVLIHHLPYQSSSEQLALYYQAADVYLHAARAEVFGLVIAEALACGTPVVATSVGGIPEVFVHQEHGLLVPPADPAQMADAVGKVLREPGLRQQYRQQAATHARKRFDQETMIDAYLNWFSEGLMQRKMAA
jgi:glycosyltransferase involved in cell wall biosynthesis